MYIMKIIGGLVVIAGIMGILYSWNNMFCKKIIFLKDFCRLYKSGRFFLAGQMVKAPAFFRKFEGESACFTQICHNISDKLLKHKYKNGAECWIQEWKAELEKNNVDNDTKKVINESGKYFFDIDAKEIDTRLSDYCIAMEKEIENETNKYIEKKKILYPVSMLGGIMLVIILF